LQGSAEIINDVTATLQGFLRTGDKSSSARGEMRFQEKNRRGFAVDLQAPSEKRGRIETRISCSAGDYPSKPQQREKEIQKTSREQRKRAQNRTEGEEGGRRRSQKVLVGLLNQSQGKNDMSRRKRQSGMEEGKSR